MSLYLRRIAIDGLLTANDEIDTAERLDPSRKRVGCSPGIGSRHC